jgi:hypothetical protein
LRYHGTQVNLFKRVMRKKRDDIYSVIREHCNDCGQVTVHDVLEGTNSGLWKSVPDQSVPNCYEEKRVGDDMYLIVLCQGCGRKGFVHHQDHYQNGSKTEIYPQKVIREFPAWRQSSSLSLPPDFLGMIDEIYAAIHNDAYRLASMGIRAALEHIFVEKVGDCGSFRANIDAFQQQGFISAIEKGSINAVLEVGHAAMHRSHGPTVEHVISMLDILEHLIQGLYVHSALAQSLTATVPVRRKRNSPQ